MMVLQLAILYLLSISTIVDSQCVFTHGSHLARTQEPVYVRASDLRIYPAQNQQGQFAVPQNENMLFLCTNPTNRNNNQVILRINNANTNTGAQILQAKCFSNRLQLTNNQIVNFGDIGCAAMPASEIIDNVNRVNPNAPKVIQVGFRVSPTMFIERYRVFFNPQVKTTYYAFSYLQSTPFSCVIDDRPNFKGDGFGLTATALNQDYTSKSRQIGQQIDRGHLVPKCDFFTGAEQFATFFYVNTNPQLHTINNGNWKNVERYVRSTINSKQGVVLESWTGASGVNQNYGYLHGTNQVPIPLFFWKVLIDIRNGAGLAIIGVNDNQRSYTPLCPDICSSIQWLRSFDAATRARVQYGQVYCCTIDNFNRIPGINRPQFPRYVPGRLLTTM